MEAREEIRGVRFYVCSQSAGQLGGKGLLHIEMPLLSLSWENKKAEVL